MLECQVSYVESCLKQVIANDLKYIDLKPDVLESYQKIVHEDLKSTSWNSGCSSWYKNEEGTIINNTPYFTFKYWWKTRKADLLSYFCVKNDKR